MNIHFKKKSVFLSFVCLIYFVSPAQKSKISVEINYGISGNFFVGSYNEIDAHGSETYFYKKKFIGPIGGVEIKYNLNQRSALGIAYSRSVNKRKVNFLGPFNNVDLSIKDFTITHTDIFDQLYYERALLKKLPAFKTLLGLFYLRMNQQEISLLYISNLIFFDERNFKNSKLEEGGTFLGFQYSKKIDTKFELSIKSRVYYLISTAAFEAITLTPTLVYNF